MTTTRRLVKASDSTPSEGDKLTVTRGEETFSPVQYNSFRLGALTITTTVKPGETIEQAYDRCHRTLEELSDKQFDAQLKAFSNRLEKARGR
jgi:hypothetical protein